MIPRQMSVIMMPLQTSVSMMPLQTSVSMIPRQTSVSMMPLQTSVSMIPRSVFSVELFICFLLEVEKFTLVAVSMGKISFSSDR
jgi:hypothetical protein